MASRNAKPVAEVAEQLRVPDQPEGPMVAALLAAGLGSLALGLLTTLAALSETLKDWLGWSEPVGPLSGKTILTVIAWLVAWAILHQIYRNKPVATRQSLTVAVVLIALGIIGTFPPFFELFAAE